MNAAGTIQVGTCTHGPVILSSSTTPELKFSITIIEFDGARHVNLINAKTTSQNLSKVWPDEVYLEDLFGRGPSKIQVSNIVRIRKEKIPEHSHIGNINPVLLPHFEQGLKVLISNRDLSSAEMLDLADSWQNLFSL
jgi:hypothetical protein